MDKLDITTAFWGREGFIIETMLKDDSVLSLRQTLDTAEALGDGNTSKSNFMWVFAQEKYNGQYIAYALIELNNLVAWVPGNAGAVIAADVNYAYEDEGALELLKNKADVLIWRHEASLRMEDRALRARVRTGK